ncbi:MAG: hypothetical protein CMJ49_06245 [Planctomycetaceae bacterium]|nr:hypothetical protein [Planctomycetaceae bacterium]
MSEVQKQADEYDVSFVMPCYNEEDIIGFTVPQLCDAFAEAGIAMQLVAVDNGSTDATRSILERLAGEQSDMVVVPIDENIGYGNGILQGLPRCTGKWVATVPADLQVDVAEVLKLFQIANAATVLKLFKVRRRFRMESFTRRIVSVTYNLLTNLLFGNLDSMDLNSVPKIIPRQYVERMQLQSTDWFLDPEIMIKARRLGLGVVEYNAFSQIRVGGKSNVRPSTCFEFVINLLSHRFGAKRSRLAVEAAGGEAQAASDATSGST